MGKHSLQTNHTKRNAAVVAAVGVGVGVLAPTGAQAAPVTIPNTGITVDVPDQVMPHIKPYLAQAGAVAQQAQAAAPIAPAPKPVGQQIVDAAMSKVGAPYVWGATGPDAFDCSGLTSWAYRQVGKNIPRTSYAQAGGGQQVPLNALQPGDIISFYGGASHVAIYIGDGKVVHAVNQGTPVRVDNMSSMPVYNAVRF